MSVTTAMSLMNFADSYALKTRTTLFQNEFSWIVSKTGRVTSQALFIPYAYKGSNYPGFFNDASAIFGQAGIKLTDITSGDPATLIANAEAIVACGGDVMTLINKLNSMVTGTFNPFNALKNRINAGVPYIGWNEGSAIISPKFFGPPSNVLSPGINASPFQIINNYKDPAQNRTYIKSYLQANSFISKAICQIDQMDGTTVRLEESGSGMIDSATAPYPLVIRYKIVDGNLEET